MYRHAYTMYINVHRFSKAFVHVYTFHEKYVHVWTMYMIGLYYSMVYTRHIHARINWWKGENKYSVPNVCPQCQTVVTKTVADSLPSPSLNCRTHHAMRIAFREMKLIRKEHEVEHFDLALPEQNRTDCTFYVLIYLETVLAGSSPARAVVLSCSHHVILDVLSDF